MLHVAAQLPPELVIDVAELPPPEVVLDREPEVDDESGCTPEVVLGLAPPKPPTPPPVSSLPDAQAAKSPAPQKAIRIKVELACFTGVW